MSSREEVLADLELATRAAEAGAAVLLEHYRPGGIRDSARSKGQRRNLVTAADRASEDAVLAILRAERPNDVIVAEETASELQSAPRVWYVDPLDGTNNFAHGLPLFCVSIALVEDGEPTVGVVHAPVLRERYRAARPTDGEPVLHAEPTFHDPPRCLRVSGTAELADAVFASGFAYDRENLADNNFDNFRNVLMRCRGMRRCGSAALDLAWVAAGRLDGFWELHLSPWDLAAGVALVRAAGGRVTDMIGGRDWLTGRHLAATNGVLHDELLSVLARPSFAR